MNFMKLSNRIVMIEKVNVGLKNSQFVAHVIFKTKHLLHLSGQQNESTMSIEAVSEGSEKLMKLKGGQRTFH